MYRTGGRPLGCFRGEWLCFPSLPWSACLGLDAMEEAEGEKRFCALGGGDQLCGGGGQSLDRLRWGAVIDFLDIRIFVFNVADVAIVVGVALLFWEVLVNDPKTS